MTAIITHRVITPDQEGQNEHVNTPAITNPQAHHQLHKAQRWRGQVTLPAMEQHQDQIRHPAFVPVTSLPNAGLSWIHSSALSTCLYLPFFSHSSFPSLLLFSPVSSFPPVLTLFVSSSFMSGKQQKLTLAIVSKIGIGRIRRRKQRSSPEQ